MADPSNTDFLVVEGVTVFRPVGQRTMRQGIEMLRDAVARASGMRVRKLLVDITGVTGYEVPSLAMRSSMVREIASAVSGNMAVAIVCRPEFIDPQKFGIKVATSLGFITDVFLTEDEAMDWLRALP